MSVYVGFVCTSVYVEVCVRVSVGVYECVCMSECRGCGGVCECMSECGCESVCVYE